MFVPQFFTVLVGTAPAIAPADPHSYANTAEVVVSRIALDLGVDFDARRLVGTAELSLDWKDPAARQLVLDTRDLEIGAVEAVDAAGAAKPATFALDRRDPILARRCVSVSSRSRRSCAFATRPRPTHRACNG